MGIIMIRQKGMGVRMQEKVEKMEYKENAGKTENMGNVEKTENMENVGKTENKENVGKTENKENAGNTESMKNAENTGHAENLKNVENVENVENVKNIENAENSGNAEILESVENAKNIDNLDNMDKNEKKETKEKPEKPEINIKREALDWIIHILIALVLGFLVVTFVIQRTAVHGISMEPTLHNGDQLIIEKISPRIGNIKNGDIVTIYVPEELQAGQDYIIKRVIGIPGDKITIKDGSVYVNGLRLVESYTSGDYTYVSSGRIEIVVEEGTIFVLGDNRFRDRSKDSRSIGPIDIERVRGKAILRFYPFDSFRVLSKPEEFQQLG
jgi:signal peptidase I